MTFKRVYGVPQDLDTFVEYCERRLGWENSRNPDKNPWELVRFQLPATSRRELGIPLTGGRALRTLRLPLPVVLSIYTNSRERTSWDPQLHILYEDFRLLTRQAREELMKAGDRTRLPRRPDGNQFIDYDPLP